MQLVYSILNTILHNLGKGGEICSMVIGVFTSSLLSLEERMLLFLLLFKRSPEEVLIEFNAILIGGVIISSIFLKT